MLTNPVVSGNQLIDPQSYITPNVLPEVTVTAPVPVQIAVSNRLLDTPKSEYYQNK